MRKRANIKVRILSRIRWLLKKILAIRIHKCIIRPHLDFIYCSGLQCSRQEKKLDNKKKAIRRIEYCNNSRHEQDIKVFQRKYNIEGLGLRRQHNLVTIMYTQNKGEM